MPMGWMLLFAATLVIVPGATAEAAILIEARMQGQPVRMVIDAAGERALIDHRRGRYLLDLERGELYRPGGGAERLTLETGAHGYRVEPWGPGPVVAGHATEYAVITHGDAICAEMLVSGWMQPFLAPLVQAMDRIEGERGAGCNRIPFAVYAAAGWPMLAGKIDHLTFETETIRFDYQPTADELDLPNRGVITEIREAIWPRG